MYVKIWHTLLYYLIFFTTNCVASSVDFDGNVNFLLTAPQQVHLDSALFWLMLGKIANLLNLLKKVAGY
jgi:hypothetical protein